MADINETEEQKIVVKLNGPYVVSGRIPLCRKIQIVSEYGEPLTWKKEGDVKTQETFSLCRCGQSSNKPFCDGTHRKVGFDGTEQAPTNTFEQRLIEFEGGTHIVVKYDGNLCMESGFCGTRLTNIPAMVKKTDEPAVRAQVMAMIERCPSGAYSYAIEKNQTDIEPDFPRQVAVTTEITSGGPIDGPLWVTGNIPVERSDGKPFEVRNRVTLCNCGCSNSKPLCDGTHRGEH